MDKRLLIVLPLCMAILFGWQFLFPPRKLPVVPAANSAAAAGTNPGPAALGSQGGADTPKVANPPDGSGAKSPDEAGDTDLTARVADSEERELVVIAGKPGQPGYYRAVFTNRGAGMRELRSGNYFDRAGLSDAEKQDWKHWWPLLGNTHTDATFHPTSFGLRTLENSRRLQKGDLGLEQELWTVKVLGDEAAPTGVEFELAPGTGARFVKRFLFRPDSDRLGLEIELHNDALQIASGVSTFNLRPVGWTVADSGDSYFPEPQAAIGWRPNPGAPVEVDSVLRDESGSELTGTLGGQRGFAFAGVHCKYFAVLLWPEPDSPNAVVGARWERLRDDDFARLHPEKADHAYKQIVTDLQLNMPMPELGKSSKIGLDVYAGPKSPDLMAAANPDLEALHRHDLGWVRWISGPLLVVLRAFHALSSSWGLSIILLTVLVRLVLFPINRRSQTAMSRYQAKMKRVQPKIEELKKRYERDPAKLRAEQARLMQQEGAFPPLGGCLPMFLQIPVFMGLYRALGISFDLRQAPFLGWIPDLALPDHMWEMNLHLPFFGTVQYLNILPPLMVALWILQQRMMPMPADEQAARMQKMMMFMPVVMGVFLYNYAAGLSLYMITQSGLGIFETKVIRKYWPVDDKEVAPKQNGFFAKMMAMQEQAERQRATQRKAR